MSHHYSRERPKGYQGCHPILSFGAIALVAYFVYLVFDSDFFDNEIANFTDVEIARYVLGRWPRTLKEVERANSYYMLEKVDDSTYNFEGVKIEPQSESECRVTFFLKNLFGRPYSETQLLHWSKADAEKCAQEDPRLNIAKQILSDISECVAEGGAIDKLNFSGASDVTEWNSDNVGYRIPRVAYLSEGRSSLIKLWFEDGGYCAQRGSLPRRIAPANISWNIPGSNKIPTLRKLYRAASLFQFNSDIIFGHREIIT